jgi:hypothetical protein
VYKLFPARPRTVWLPCGLLCLLHMVPSLASELLVNPAGGMYRAGETQQFRATEYGNADLQVRWSVQPSIGSITASGLYTVPAAVVSGQEVVITATDVSNPSRSKSVTAALLSRDPPLGKLKLSRDGTQRSDQGDAEVTFSISVRDRSSVKSLVLQDLDSAGNMAFELGQLHDDGVDGDAAANDGTYSLRLKLPISRPGWMRFRAWGTFTDLPDHPRSLAAEFGVQPITEQNATGDFWGGNDGGASLLYWEVASDAVAKEVLYRAQSTFGPWEAIFVGTYPPSERKDRDPEAKGYDPDKNSVLADWYYKLEAYDDFNRLLKSYGQIMIPRYLDPDDWDSALLILEGMPLRARYANAPKPN